MNGAMARENRGGRAVRTGFAVASTMLAALALTAASAMAAKPHVYSFEITGSGPSKLSRPAGVAVDNSAGMSAHDIYVTDPDKHRVVKFGPAGDFILMFGEAVNQTTGGDVCTAASGNLCGAGSPADQAGQPAGSLSNPDSIAVDGSGGPSAGDVYVGDIDTAVVSKFDSAGHLIASWGTGGQIAIDAIGISGLAVGSDGKLVVVGFNFENESALHSKLFQYDQDGLNPSVVVTGVSFPSGLALDAAGNRYKIGWSNVEEVDPSGASVREFEADSPSHGLAIDPSDDNLYVKSSGRVSRFPASCSVPVCHPTETFGEGYMDSEWGGGVGVDAFDHTVYVSQGANGRGGYVAVFAAPGKVPEVSTGESPHLTKGTVRLEGEVDPAGAGDVTACEFEYIDRLSFFAGGWAGAATAPCAQSPPYSDPEHVTATLTGLKAGAFYRYRLVAANATGRRTGLGREFEIGSLIEAATGSFADLSDSDVTLTAVVEPDPGGTPVSGCMFERVDYAHFEREGFTRPDRDQCSQSLPFSKQPLTVTAHASGLSPETTYLYRTFAWDFYGSSTGIARSFTTPPRLVIPDPPEEELKTDRRRRRGGKRVEVRCAKRACIRTLEGARRPQTWVSPKFPSSYGWLFSVYKGGESLPHSKPADGCISTFRGRGVKVVLNGCRGRFRITYRGSGEFKLRWRVFKSCRCAENTGDRRRSLP
jgi:hypothetical protein